MDFEGFRLAIINPRLNACNIAMLSSWREKCPLNLSAEDATLTSLRGGQNEIRLLTPVSPIYDSQLGTSRGAGCKDNLPFSFMLPFLSTPFASEEQSWSAVLTKNFNDIFHVVIHQRSPLDQRSVKDYSDRYSFFDDTFKKAFAIPTHVGPSLLVRHKTLWIETQLL